MFLREFFIYESLFVTATKQLIMTHSVRVGFFSCKIILSSYIILYCIFRSHFTHTVIYLYVQITTCQFYSYTNHIVIHTGAFDITETSGSGNDVTSFDMISLLSHHLGWLTLNTFSGNNTVNFFFTDITNIMQRFPQYYMICKILVVTCRPGSRQIQISNDCCCIYEKVYLYSI